MMKINEITSEAEIKELCNMAETVWHSAYDALLPPGQVEYMLAKYQSPKAVKRQIVSEGYRYYMFFADDTPCGFTGIVPGYKQANELFLSKLYVLSEFEGRGFARQGFDFVVQQAKNFNCGSVWLTVNKGNSHAVEVYRHLGFTVEREEKTDIGGGYFMDDFIMRASLNLT